MAERKFSRGKCKRRAHSGKKPKKGREARINQMSEAYDKLREVSGVLGETSEKWEAVAPLVDLLKDYMVSGRWLEDFEADERGEIGPDVNRSVLSEDGLYNLLEDLDGINKNRPGGGVVE